MVDQAEQNGDGAVPKLGEAELVVPGLVRCTIEGHVRLEAVERLIFTANDDIRRDLRVGLYIDAFGAVGYEAECRKVFQTWALRNRASIEGVWILYSSPLIKMGASLVSAYTGGLVHAISVRAQWEQVLARALEDHPAAVSA
jgi:hypothetical protein